MNSIRKHLMVRLTVGLFLIFGVLGATLYFFIKHSLVAQFDSALRTTAKTFAAMSELELEGEFGFEFFDTPLAEFQVSPTAAYFQVWDDSKRVLARSPSLGQADLPRLDIRRAVNVVLPDGRPGRTLTLHFAPRLENVADEPPYELAPPGKHLYVTIARSLQPIRATLQVLGPAIALGGLVLALCTVFVVRFTVGRALQPLGKLASEVAVIDQDNLDHRFSIQGIPLELSPVTLRLNELLARLKIAFQRERRFTANVSHELRTPIAELRALAEVGGDCVPPSMPELRAHFDDALKIAAQLETLVSTLLALARAEAGTLTPTLDRVDLTRLTQQVWMPFLERVQSRALQVHCRLDQAVWVTSDSGLLSALLHNLFDNATLYTPSHGRIHLRLERIRGRAQLTLVNQTESVTADDLEHFCEPFWRQDESRTGQDHAGLGLTVVQAFARLLRLNFSLDIPSAGEVRFRLLFADLPASPPQRPPVFETRASNASNLTRTLTT